MLLKSTFLLALVIHTSAFPLESDGSGSEQGKCVCPAAAEPLTSTVAPQMCICPAQEEPSTTSASPEPCVCPPPEELSTTPAAVGCVCPALEEPSTTEAAAPEPCVCPPPEEPSTTPAAVGCVCPALEEPSTTTTAAPPQECVCPVLDEATSAPQQLCQCPLQQEPATTPAPQPLTLIRPPCCCCAGRRRKCGCGCGNGCGNSCGNGCNSGCGRPADEELPRPAEISADLLTCPDGWIRYQQSCYYMETAKMTLQNAERACNEKGGSLFVADSLGEFNEVMKESPLYFWSWIGLGQNDASGYPRWQSQGMGLSPLKCLPADSGNLPLWDGMYGMNPAELKWLVTPFSSASNGWSTAATCVAHYNIDIYTSTYLYFYPCSYEFYSICEKNSTLLGY
ncbi:hypothetical protein NECAME_09330 [Necator americanus]|uniref:C-type lectin domain-containing protein n=1 Tax=Necator americanus TaxID=51031 RepID=W2TGN8_NECAM|nr:hypothetical protein NECAME_09330 [Necator americanus]ETN80197.1 hypothetical protein NECAME_09330 [Necator americanus]